MEKKALDELCLKETIKPDVFKTVLSQYEYTPRYPAEKMSRTRSKISERNEYTGSQNFIESFYRDL